MGAFQEDILLQTSKILYLGEGKADALFDTLINTLARTELNSSRVVYLLSTQSVYLYVCRSGMYATVGIYSGMLDWSLCEQGLFWKEKAWIKACDLTEYKNL